MLPQVDRQVESLLHAPGRSDALCPKKAAKVGDAPNTNDASEFLLRAEDANEDIRDFLDAGRQADHLLAQVAEGAIPAFPRLVTRDLLRRAVERSSRGARRHRAER